MVRSRKTLLVTGCGRSGTKYVAFLLKAGGLDVMHERGMGTDGISSWLFGVDSDRVPWGPSPSEYSFDHVVHLSRDPRLAIPSIATFKGASWDYIERHVPVGAQDTQLLKAAKYWLDWNEFVEKKTDLRIRIEDAPDAIDSMCRSLGLPFDVAAAERVPTDLNTRRYGKWFHVYENRCLRLNLVLRNSLLKGWLARRQANKKTERLAWEDLESLDPGLTERIRLKADEYGY